MEIPNNKYAYLIYFLAWRLQQQFLYCSLLCLNALTQIPTSKKKRINHPFLSFDYMKALSLSLMITFFFLHSILGRSCLKDWIA